MKILIRKIVRFFGSMVTAALRKIICFFRGHDFGPVVYISPAVLTYCHRDCGKEIQDRTFADLEPMTDEDYEYLESLEWSERGVA